MQTWEQSTGVECTDENIRSKVVESTAGVEDLLGDLVETRLIDSRSKPGAVALDAHVAGKMVESRVADQRNTHLAPSRLCG